MSNRTAFLSFFSILGLLFASTARAEWIQHQRVGDRVYFLEADSSRVDVYDLSSATFQAGIPLVKTPVAFDVDETAMVVAFSDRTVSLLALDGTSSHEFPAFPGAVMNLFLRDQEIGVDFMDGYSGRVQVFDRSTFALESSSSSSRPSYARTLSLSEGEERFVVSDTLKRFTSRTLLPTANSNPDNPDFLANPLLTDSFYGYDATDVIGWSRMLPGGERFITQAGLIYRVDDCTYAGSVGGVIDDVAFTSSGGIVLLRGAHVTWLNADRIPQGVFTLPEAASSIAVEGTKVTAFRADAAEPPGIATETVLFSQFVPETISTPAPPDPYGLSYTPEDAFTDANGVLHILHATEAALYRWDPDIGEWMEPIVLQDNPSHMVYDEVHNRLYLSYPYRIHVLRLDEGETGERFFAFTPGLSRGMRIAGGWLYLETDLNSDGTVRVYDLQTGSAVNNGASVYLSWLYRPEGSSFLYSLQAQYGRMYRFTIEADGTIGSRVKITTSSFGHPVTHPDGQFLLTDTGNVFGIPDFTLVGDPVLPYAYEDAEWTLDTLYTLGEHGEGDARLHSWGLELEPGWERVVEGAPLLVSQGGDRVHTVTQVEGQPMVSSFLENGAPLSQSVVNRTPGGIDYTGSEVPLGMEVGDEVGRFLVQDPNTGDTHQLSLIVDGQGLFELVGDQLRLAALPGNLDAPELRTVKVRAEDPLGEWVEAEFHIEVHTPGNQPAPPITSPGLSVWKGSKTWMAKGVVYILDYARPYIHRWEIESRAYLDPISLRGIGTNFTVDPDRNRVFVSYPSLAMTEIDLEDPALAERMWGKMRGWGSRIEPAGTRYVEIPNYENDGYWYDRQGRPLGSFSESNVSDDVYTWSNSRLFTMRSGKLSRFAFDDAYELQPHPVHRSGLGMDFNLNEEGTRLLETDGHVLDADDLSILGRLGEGEYRHVSWLGDDMLTLDANGVFSRWSPDLEGQAQSTVEGSSSTISSYELWSVDNEAVILSWPEGQPRFTVYNRDLVPVFVSPINLPPEAISPLAIEFPEDTPAGTPLVTFTVTDPFPDITHTLEILPESDPNPFGIAGLDLVLSEPVDYFEDPRSYSLDILCTDRFGETLEQTVVVTVRHVPRPPSDVGLEQEVLVEGDPVGTPVGILTVVDRDPETGHVFELIDDSDGLVSLSGRQLTLAGDLPREGAYTRDISVRVTNSHGLSYTETLTLDVYALPELTVTLPPVSGVNENMYLEGTVTSDHGISLLEWYLNGGWMGELSLNQDVFTLDAAVPLEGENTFRFRVTDPWQHTVEGQSSVFWTPERVLDLRPIPTPMEGQFFEVPLWLEQTGDVGSFQFEISYDPFWFREPGFTINSDLPVMLSEVNVDPEAGTVRGTLAWGFLPPPGDVRVGTLSLRARSVPEMTEVSLDTRLIDAANGFGVGYTFGNHGRAATVSIQPRDMVGDTNGNGEIDIADVTAMQRLLMGLDPMRDWDGDANDVNMDGHFSVADLSWAFRVVLGERSQPTGNESGEMAAMSVMADGSEAPAQAATFGTPSGPAFTFRAERLVGAPDSDWICWVRVASPPDGLSSVSFRLVYPVEALTPVVDGFVVPGEGFPALMRGHHHHPSNDLVGEVAFAASGGEGLEDPDSFEVGFRFRVLPGAGERDWLIRVEDAEMGMETGGLARCSRTLALFSTRSEPRPGYGTWASRHLWPYTDSVRPLERPYAGEATNWMRYAMGHTALDRTEGIRMRNRGAALRFERNRNAPDVRYVLEASRDLRSWSPVPETERREISTPLADGREEVEWVPEWSGADPDQPVFYRLNVEGTP